MAILKRYVGGNWNYPLSFGGSQWVSTEWSIYSQREWPIMTMIQFRSSVHNGSGVRSIYVSSCRAEFTWWRHQMETFSALLAFLRGIHRWIPFTKGQWRGALMFSLICAWINGWVNSREAGDLRRHRAHYDVTVMIFSTLTWYGLLKPLLVDATDPFY